ncbi:tetratricopeptide repeat protein [Lutibacter sp. Hel_I_33_5]|nr:tetratricopeptide repeat protein [Lutibacter sp. Hel_I_33_5]
MILILGCSNPKNSSEFIEKASGRYLFNANETMEIYFKEQILFVKWRGNENLEPLKVNDSTFYLKELNEKLVFVSNPSTHIKLAPKREHKEVVYKFRKLTDGEKTPKEHLIDKNFDLALESYLNIQKKDSLNKSIQWNTINNLAHRYFKTENKETALSLFEINIKLYPKKPAVYRNYGYALMEIKDTINAIKNYKKALSIYPDDQRAIKFLNKHKTK